jgi:hypothetical protein
LDESIVDTFVLVASLLLEEPADPIGGRNTAGRNRIRLDWHIEAESEGPPVPPALKSMIGVAKNGV